MPGSLRQDEISLRLQLRGVLVRLLPLHQSVLEVLAPDSFRAMSEQLRFRRDRIDRAAQTHGVAGFSIWYVTFQGLEPDARFSPGELVISAAGRDFRPIEIIPLSSGFGQQRIQQGQSQTAMYLFDPALDVQQPLEASIGDARTDEWSAIIRAIEREHLRLRSRRIDTTAAHAARGE
jgi:hypothetical protein